MDFLEDETQFRAHLESFGLRFRSSQWQMLKSVRSAFQNKQFACLEAPTGTGKTLAYTLAGLAAKKPTQYLVIATATTALQNQFIKQDIPLIERLLDKDITANVAKGRRQFLCLAKLYQQPVLDTGNEKEVHFYRTAKSAIERQQWGGEKDDAPAEFDEQIWQKVTASSSECLGSNCHFFKQCFFFKHKWQMTQSEVVVTNHNLLLSDFELGGGVVLPDPARSLYVIDEGHHYHEKALNHFAKQTAMLRAQNWLDNFHNTLIQLQTIITISNSGITQVSEWVRNIMHYLTQLHGYYYKYLDEFNKQDLLLLETIDPEPWRYFEKLYYISLQFRIWLSTVAGAIDLLLEEQKSERTDSSEQQQTLIRRFQFLYERLDNFFQTIEQMLVVPDKQQAPMAKWLAKHNTGEGVDFTIHTAPINAGQFLKEQCWEQMPKAAVLCSATLQTTNGFQDLLRKTGLKSYEPECQALPSHFDYEHSILFVPEMDYEPLAKHHQAYLDEVSPLLQTLLAIGRSHLLLFTSRQTMHDVYNNLDQSWRDNILMQGSCSHQKLINSHKRRVDEGRSSILLGLLSLAEGLDLPGQYCEHVIIQKLPFSVPSDPVQKTRTKWLYTHRMDPFKKVALPEAGLKLKQFAGRLLRTETDQGIITILDKRVYSRSYGGKLLACLPPFKQYVAQNTDYLRQLWYDQ